ncbi:hypothetical protein D3C86_1866520 [compost metagenome]
MDFLRFGLIVLRPEDFRYREVAVDKTFSFSDGVSFERASSEILPIAAVPFFIFVLRSNSFWAR